MKKAFYFVILLLVSTLLWQCVQEKKEALTADMRQELVLLSNLEHQEKPFAGFAYMNFSKIRQSPFYEMIVDSLRTRMHKNKDFEEFAEASGFDLREDVDQVYVAFDTPQKRHEENMLIVAIGNYNVDKIEHYIAEEDREHKLVKEKYNEFTIYRIEDKDNVFCMANQNYAVGGKVNLVKSWLNNFKAGSESVSIEPELLARIEQIQYKSGAWVVMNAGAMVSQFMDRYSEDSRANRFSALRSIKNVHLSMNVDEKFRVSGIGQFTDEEKAGLFRDAIKGALATLKLSMSDDREAVDVVNKVNITKKDSDVRVQFEMTKTDVEKLIQRQRKFARR